MNQEYSISYSEHIVGKAEVKKEGLYYHFRCVCHLQKDNIYTVIVSCNGTEQNLGVCVPMDGRLGLETKVPIKHIGEGTFTFRVVSKHSEEKEVFYPVSAVEPFTQLTQLENAYFCMLDNKPGVRLKGLKADF